MSTCGRQGVLLPWSASCARRVAMCGHARNVEASTAQRHPQSEKWRVSDLNSLDAIIMTILNYELTKMAVATAHD